MQLEWIKVLIILLCAVVTFVPRILPFVVVNKLRLPKRVLVSLKYIPVCMFTALVMTMLFDIHDDTQGARHITLHWDVILATLFTLYIAFRTASLAKSVLLGMAFLYLLRLWL